MERAHFPIVLLLLTVVVLGLSAIGPKDRLTWFLEVAPIMIGGILLVFTYGRFSLSHFLYGFLFLHAVILAVGGHYTYAEVPVGFWAQETFGLSRNPYDRLGHFAQGLVPAILAREILSRSSPLAQSRWLPFVVVSICLAFSAFYELLEWWAAIGLGQSAEQFLGTQGDVWDTQWDMFLALIGAILFLLTLRHAHDRSMMKVKR
jgi:putative membrane protein